MMIDATTSTIGSERKRNASDWIPIGCFVVALLMAIFVLPTILRQSPPQTNQTAQLSPDAPQNNQQSLIQVLKRGTTSTAGVGTGRGNGPGGGIRPLPPPPPIKAQGVPSACKYGYGNPPRQTFSVYSAPCALPFSGDNGGVTAPGVTATEIRVGQYGGPSAGRQCAPGSTSSELLCDWEAWINSRYQFYGRQMHFYNIATGTDPSGAEAGAVNARAQNMFAVTDLLQASGQLTPDSVAQKLVTWTFYRPDSFFRASAPYAWSWQASNDRIIEIEAELVCKQLAGKPPSFNEHQDQHSIDYSQPRKFAAVMLEQGGGTSNEDLLKKGLARCGLGNIATYPYTQEGGDNNLATAMLAMQSNHVSTILDFGDQLATGTMASDATKSNYFPEWVAFATHGLEDANFDQGIDPTQWRHAIGTSFNELPRAITEMDWFIAACQVDPNCSSLQASSIQGESPLHAQGIFNTYIEMANGFQLAGPHLTPESFQSGLQTEHRPPDPYWAVGGSYQDPDPWSFEKYAAFMWWNPDANDPTTGNAGAWEFMNNGHRYTTGEVPTAPLPFFKSGVLQPTGDGTRQ